MTFKIELERLGPLGADGFAKLIEQHIATLKEYDEHEAVVREHAADLDKPEGERWQSLAVPAAPIEIDGSIKRTLRPDGTTEFTPDYEIAGPSFVVRKSRLLDAVSAAERDAIAAVAPAGKLRAFQFREQDIRAADHARWADVDHEKYPNFEQHSYLARPPEDTKFMDEQASREAMRQTIYRWAAGLHSDIEDLTPEAIDTFVVTSFNG